MGEGRCSSHLPCQAQLLPAPHSPSHSNSSCSCLMNLLSSIPPQGLCRGPFPALLHHSPGRPSPHAHILAHVWVCVFIVSLWGCAQGGYLVSSCRVSAPGMHLVCSTYLLTVNLGPRGLSRQGCWFSEGGKLEGARKTLAPGCLPLRPQFLPVLGNGLRDSESISLMRWFEGLDLQTKPELVK